MELNMFYPATGASKNLVPEKCDTLDSCWRQSTGTRNWHQKTGKCVITLSVCLRYLRLRCPIAGDIIIIVNDIC